MLLPRIRTTFRPINVLRRGNATASGSLYHEKVRAFPFAVSRDEVISRIGPYISYFGAGEGMIGSLGARYLPGFGFKAIQPAAVQAAYLPLWFVDAEMEAKVWLPQRQGAEPSQQTAFAYLTDSYVPGLALDPLSRISFNTVAIHISDTVPFTEDLKKQHNEDILCPPFQFTPFHFPELANSLSYQQATVSQHFRFDPSSVKANLIAAYPILFPVYLFQYHLNTEAGENGTLHVTAICDASRPDAPFIVNNIDTAWRDLVAQVSPNSFALKKVKPFKEHYEFLKLGELKSDNATSFASIFGFSDLHNAATRRRELRTWLDDRIKPKGALETYRRIWKEKNNGRKSVDFEDLRIREYTKPERRAIRNWMQYGQLVQSYQKVIETLSAITGDDEGEPTVKEFGPLRFEWQIQAQVGPQEEKQPPESRVKGFKAQLEEAMKLREANKPEWFRQWEEQQGLAKVTLEKDKSDDSEPPSNEQKPPSESSSPPQS